MNGWNDWIQEALVLSIVLAAFVYLGIQWRRQRLAGSNCTACPAPKKKQPIKDQ